MSIANTGTEPLSDFEQSLNALDAQLQEIQKAGKAVVSAVARARSATKLGRASEIAKLLDDIAKRIGEAGTVAGGLPNGWSFDTTSYLADGRFLADLKSASADRGVSLFEKDGRIYCFPLLLRVDPKENAIKIGRKLERRIRPSELARLLALAQKRPQRFSERQFLALLYRAWRRLAGPSWRGAGIGPAIYLADIHDTLTLLPGADYPIEEFARDLLLLDRRPDLLTGDGCRFEFPAAALARAAAKQLVVYDEGGSQRTYVAVRFVKEA